MKSRQSAKLITKKSGICQKHMANYETLRPFLRFISYGCYTKVDYPQSNHTYDNNLARLRRFLPPERLPDILPSPKNTLRLKGDAFIDSDNFLMNTFRAKRMTKYDLFYKFHLLRVLNTATTPLLSADLLRKMETGTLTALNCPTDKGPEDVMIQDINTMRRHLNDLIDIGLVITQSQGKRTSYRLAPNPLTGLSTSEQQELLAAVAFHKNDTLLSVPGYYLETTLRRMYPAASVYPSMYQFKNLNFTRIIDDEIVFQILCAIEQKRLVTFHYTQEKNGKEISKILTVFPAAIITDYLTGSRQYLIAYAPVKTKHRTCYTLRQTFRLENISHLRFEKPLSSKIVQYHQPKGIPILFRIFFSSPEERKRLLFRVKERFPHVSFSDENENSILCKVHCLDHLRHAPWFRTLYPDVEVLHTPRSYLCQYLENTRKETLKNYGQQT